MILLTRKPGPGRSCPSCGGRLINALPCPGMACRLARKKSQLRERHRQERLRHKAHCLYCDQPREAGSVYCLTHQTMPHPCANLSCLGPVARPPRGRHPEHCCDACRVAHWRAENDEPGQSVPAAL